MNKPFQLQVNNDFRDDVLCKGMQAHMQLKCIFVYTNY